MLGNHWLALVVTFLLAAAWLRINDHFAHRGYISSSVSRKIIHIGTGPIFVLCWLLFPETSLSRYLASLIPLAITFQFALVGLGIIKDPSAVDAMSRSGDRNEILRGPLFYGVMFVILTLGFWKHDPIGITALMILCGGDGLADIVGKKVKSGSLPWSPRKTWLGSLAMFLGSLIFSLFVIGIFVLNGALPGTVLTYLAVLLIISLGCTLVESLPYRDVDNITVPVVAVILGYLLF